MKKLILLFVIFGLLQACTTQPQSRYQMRVDSAPIELRTAHEPSTIVPQYEPYRLANMREYSIAGIKYQPMLTGYQYAETGYASWYGQKFDGHQTATGEIFDMYELTAAHKTLPLPSFAQVTNLENGKQIWVRINDRGPFHPNRIIDLSFAAAKELDFLKNGTAKVKVEVIYVDENDNVTIGVQPKETLNALLQRRLPASPLEPPVMNNSVNDSISDASVEESLNDSVNHNIEETVLVSETDIPTVKLHYIQIFASRERQKVENKAQALQVLYNIDYEIIPRDNIFVLKIGPYRSVHDARLLLNEVLRNDYSEAFIVSKETSLAEYQSKMLIQSP